MSDQWVVIYSFTYPSEAYVIKSRLESEGIACMLKDELTIQVDTFYSNAMNGVKLQVHEYDAENAVSIMKEVGYSFNNTETQSKWLASVIRFTEKMPVIGKLETLWRLMILVALLVATIVTTTVIIQNKHSGKNFGGERILGPTAPLPH